MASVRNSDGYILIRNPNHHRANYRGDVLEHILVAEKKLGRRLKPKEVVHHIDENRANNHSDNLDVMPLSEHSRIHNAGKKASSQTRKKMRESSRKENNSRWLKNITEDKIILASLLFKKKLEMAKFLGIGRTTLYKRIKYYKVESA